MVSIAYLVLVCQIKLAKLPPQFNEHFYLRASVVFEHNQSCSLGREKENFSIQYSENIQSHGIYSIRRGVLNIKKILKR